MTRQMHAGSADQGCQEAAQQLHSHPKRETSELSGCLPVQRVCAALGRRAIPAHAAALLDILILMHCACIQPPALLLMVPTTAFAELVCMSHSGIEAWVSV